MTKLRKHHAACSVQRPNTNEVKAHTLSPQTFEYGSRVLHLLAADLLSMENISLMSTQNPLAHETLKANKKAHMAASARVTSRSATAARRTTIATAHLFARAQPPPPIRAAPRRASRERTSSRVEGHRG